MTPTPQLFVPAMGSCSGLLLPPGGAPTSRERDKYSHSSAQVCAPGLASCSGNWLPPGPAPAFRERDKDSYSSAQVCAPAVASCSSPWLPPAPAPASRVEGEGQEFLLLSSRVCFSSGLLIWPPATSCTCSCFEGE